MNKTDQQLHDLCVHMNKVMAFDAQKEESYIIFLKIHGLTSGPTPELLKSLNNEQRHELAKIFQA